MQRELKAGVSSLDVYQTIHLNKDDFQIVVVADDIVVAFEMKPQYVSPI
jgi:hypothetical protein